MDGQSYAHSLQMVNEAHMASVCLSVSIFYLYSPFHREDSQDALNTTEKKTEKK